MFIFIILFILLLVLLVTNIHIVPQAHCYVLERLGQYLVTWEAGFHIKVPIFDRIVNKISLKEN